MPATDSPAWSENNLADPHHVADKRARVQKMFSAIAGSYDLNNRVHSFGRDQAWRRRAVKLAKLKPTDVVVDVACGTGDLTFAFVDGLKRVAGKLPAAGQVIGIDFTFAMLPLARDKAEPYGRVPFTNGDAQSLPLPDACCDVVSIAFGIRNVQDIPTALKEFRRILRPGGRLVILEFSKPTNPLIRIVNDVYTGKVMPLTATLISGDKSGAYKYLPKSVDTFISRQAMADMMTAAGFGQITQTPMTFGVCIAYRGVAGV